MYFKYIGYDDNKEILKGIVEAPSFREAIQELEREGVFVILSLKRSRVIPVKKRLVEFKDRFINSAAGKIVQKSTVEIDLKDVEIIKALKNIDLEKLQVERSGNIFARPAEEVEFKEKRERRKSIEKEIDWSLIRQSPENIEKLKVPMKEIAYFTRQLSILLNSGVSLPVSLMTLVEHTRNKKMKHIINEINRKIQEGESLSSAMATFPNQFNDLYVSLVYVGESSGALPECLRDLAEFQESQIKIRKKVRSSMIYPIIVLVVVAILLMLGSHFLIPMFKDLFEDMGMELPRLTKFVFWIAEYIKYIVAGILALIAFLIILAPHMGPVYKTIRRIADRLFLKLPIIKKTVLTSSMFYFSSPLALMQKNGVRLIDSLMMVYNVVPNSVIKEEIQDATYLLMEGASISEALEEQPHFDSVICSMVRTGEDSGRLDQTLEHLSDYYTEQLQADLEALINAVQPMTILFIAAIVIPIIFAIAIPLFDLTSGGFLREGI